MKSMIAVLAVSVLLFSPGLATADDKDDVIAAMLDYISGWNDGDAAKVAQYMPRRLPRAVRAPALLWRHSIRRNCKTIWTVALILIFLT